MNMSEGGNGGTRAGTRPGEAPGSNGALLQYSVMVVVGVGVCVLIAVWMLRTPAESPAPSGGVAAPVPEIGRPVSACTGDSRDYAGRSVRDRKVNPRGGAGAE